MCVCVNDRMNEWMWIEKKKTNIVLFLHFYSFMFWIIIFHLVTITTKIGPSIIIIIITVYMCAVVCNVNNLQFTHQMWMNERKEKNFFFQFFFLNDPHRYRMNFLHRHRPIDNVFKWIIFISLSLSLFSCCRFKSSH